MHANGESLKVTQRKKPTTEDLRLLLMVEQSILAKERTILSFMRTGMLFIGVGFGLVAFYLSQSNLSLFIGVMLVALGLVEVIESTRRLYQYKQKMKKLRKRLGRVEPLNEDL